MLINPNTSTATTAMMTAIARRTLGPALPVRGVTVTRGPRMLTDPAALRAAAPEVLATGLHALTHGDCAALLVAAFGDPGLAELREATAFTRATSATETMAATRATSATETMAATRATSTAGATEATEAAWVTEATATAWATEAVRAASAASTSEAARAAGATSAAEAAWVTAAAGIPSSASARPRSWRRPSRDALRCRHHHSAPRRRDRRAGRGPGPRRPVHRAPAHRGRPERLSADPELLLDQLERAVRACVERDGARAVVIGGGPLGEAAERLQERCEVRVVAPIPAACRAIARLLRA
ncbi:aspartate/glutamate racemase family protein [Streptomyces diastatochromogenes]|nr:aspartate/glutamate racemase family protein [Streptomyces diastatochromogenes]